MPNVIASGKANEPAYFAAAITTSDAVDQANPINRIYVGGTGDINIVTVDGTTVLFKAVPVGTILPIRPLKVKATGTTATLMVGLW